jgi:hypothetical protein
MRTTVKRPLTTGCIGSDMRRKMRHAQLDKFLVDCRLLVKNRIHCGNNFPADHIERRAGLL